MAMKASGGAGDHRRLWIGGTALLSLAALGVSCVLLHEGVSNSDRLSDVPGKMDFAIGLEIGVAIVCLAFLSVPLACSLVRRFGPAEKVKNAVLCLVVLLACAVAFGTAAYLIVLRGLFPAVMKP